MKSNLLIFFFIISTCFAGTIGYAQDIPDSHEIIQKLASSPMFPVPKTTIVSMNIPASWESQVIAGDSVSFRVPFHPGVVGKLEKISEPSSIETDIELLNSRYHTEFKVESQNPVQNNMFSGYQATISGRLGGEIWKLRVWSGTVAHKIHIRFYAQSPDFWFQVYVDFFDEILASVQPK